MDTDRGMSARARTLWTGIAALTKSLVLVIGVPAAGFRLFDLSRTGGRDEYLRLATNLLLAGVALCWAQAVRHLAGEIRRALHHPDERTQSTWSSSWAGGIVGLLMLGGALSSAPGSLAQRTAPITQTLSAEHLGALRNAFPNSSQRSPLFDELLGGLGAITAAALLRRTRLLARLRTSVRTPNARTRTLSDDLQLLVSTMESSSHETTLDWIESINRFLGAIYINANAFDVPEISLMRVGAEGIELLLEKPVGSAPKPFVADQQGWWWRLDSHCQLMDFDERSRNGPRLAPWLLPIGNDGSGDVLVALGPGRALGLIGAAETVDDTLRALVTGLRVLPWCDELAVELCGIEAPPLAEQSMHLQHSSVQTLSELYGTPRTARSAMRDNWRREPLVVIHRQAVNESSRSMLIAITGSVGALVGDQVPQMNLRLTDQRAHLEPFGIDLDTHLLSSENERIIDRLLSAYAQPNEIVVLQNTRPEMVADRAAIGACEIAILGRTVELHGAQHQPHVDDVGRIHELLIFLALHNRRASSAQLLNALFIGADTIHARTRLENLIALSRAMLGRATDGGERIRKTSDDLVVMDSSVTLDWHRIQRSIIEAQSLDGGAAISLLQDALSHCASEPILGEVARYPWFHATRYDELIISSLLDACHHLSTLTNVSGSREIAHWAIAIGKRLEPASEIMVRDQMMVLDAEGRSEEIPTVYGALQRELVALGGAEPSAITHQLYLALTMRERTV